MERSHGFVVLRGLLSFLALSAPILQLMHRQRCAAASPLLGCCAILIASCAVIANAAAGLTNADLQLVQVSEPAILPGVAVPPGPPAPLTLPLSAQVVFRYGKRASYLNNSYYLTKVSRPQGRELLAGAGPGSTHEGRPRQHS